MLFFITMDPLEIRAILMLSSSFLSIALSLILMSVLHFWLDFAGFVKNISDEYRLIIYGCCLAFSFGGSFFVGLCTSCLMIIPYGPTIEKMITYVMNGDNNNDREEEEDDDCQEHHTWQIRSPNYIVWLDVPLPISNSDTWEVQTVNHKRMVIIRCAFMVIQIFVYLSGCIAGVYLDGKQGRIFGGVAVSSLSVFLVCALKLFSASHQYSLIVAKWVLSHSCVFEIVFLALGVRDYLDLTHYYIPDLCFGAFPILVALYAMRNPVDKLYTIYYDITKKTSNCMEVKLQID